MTKTEGNGWNFRVVNDKNLKENSHFKTTTHKIYENQQEQMANDRFSYIALSNQTIPNDSNSTDTVYVTSGVILDRLNRQQFIILIPSFVLVLTTLVTGLTGNIITTCVYIRKMRNTSSRLFILALAFCDLANCVVTMPLELGMIVQFWTFDYPVVCSIGRSLTYIFNGASALLLCCIAIDRYRKICLPLKPTFQSKTIMFLSALSLAVACAFYIPAFLIYGTQTIEIDLNVNDTHVIAVGKTCLVNDEHTQSKLVKGVMVFWFLATIGIMIVLIVFYSLIGRAVYRRAKLNDKRPNSVSFHSKRKLSTAVIADQSSETSCSFEGILVTERVSPVILTTMTESLRTTIKQSLKNRFSFSKPNTVQAVKKDKISKRIRVGRTTLMLFFVTIAYVLSYIPFITIIFIRTASPDTYIGLNSAEKSVWNFFLRSYLINCAVNPLLYGFLNKDFRKKMIEFFKEMLCCQQ